MVTVDIGWATSQERFRAMGTDCHLLVVGPAGQEHLEFARNRVAELERRWSRFDPGSEISRLRLAPEGLTVSVDTYYLVEHAVVAWQLTGGRFDPTMANRMAELGYDRTFERLDPPIPALAAALSGPIGGHEATAAANEEYRSQCGDIELNRNTRRVRLPSGVGFDPGGIGKGYAADLVSAELMDRGAWGAMVNLGGDLRVRGTPPTGDAWVIAISEPTVSAEPLATVRLIDCGLATSTTTKRRWSANGEERHHLLDSTTGLPHEPAVDLVSVVAEDGWWAEAVATALTGSDPDTAGQNRTSDPTPAGCAALRVLADGTVQRLSNFERYEA